MVKKNWESPELMGLGLGATKEDGLGDDGQVMTLYKCEYCDQRFWTKKARNEHQKHCPNGGSMLPNEGEGGPIPTFS